MDIASRVLRVQEEIYEAALACGRNPQEISLVAATKTQTDQRITEAIAAGITICGENRVQEMAAHQNNNVYNGAELHFIGHLQSNKVKQVVGQVSLIHSVGSRKLMEEIGKQAKKLDIVQNILLEINVEREESKSGFFVEDFNEIQEYISTIEGIRVKGLMAIPPKMENQDTQAKIFEKLYNLYIDFSEKIKDNGSEIAYLSMGMSDDFRIAIAQGSTMVRVGTALFGSRAYP